LIVCAGNNETFSFATSMGVGLVDMTLNLTRACIMNPPEFLLFVGSAGSYGKYKPFDIVESMKASQIELSFLQKNAYTPIDNVVEADAKNVSHETMVNSSNYISTNMELTENFQKFGIGLENMEFFAFLRVAQEFNIPAGGIFVVTNYTDENAHADFMQNHKLAMDKLAHYVDKRMTEMFDLVEKQRG
jgi:nucleoside phosphorylase